ncbi:unnamed protein product [Symbiodinium sp. CCMP2592]|nr:unnamed protein product [Symbiodinium sp. CCMP2592]
MPETMKPMTPGLVSTQRVSSKDSAKRSDGATVETQSTATGNNSPRASENCSEVGGTQEKTGPVLPLQKRESVAWCDIKDEEEFEDYNDADGNVPFSPSVKSTATTPSRSGRRAERRARRRREAQKAAQQQVNSRGPTAVTFAELGVECSQSPTQTYTGPGTVPSPGADGNWPGIMSTAPADQPKQGLFLPPGALGYPGCPSPTSKPSCDASARGYPYASPNAAVASPDVSAKRLLLATSPKAPFGGDASSRTPCRSPPSWTADVPSPCRSRMSMRSFVNAQSPSSGGGLVTSPSVNPGRRGGNKEPCLSPASPEVTTLRQLLGSQAELEGTREELAARLQAAAPESYED